MVMVAELGETITAFAGTGATLTRVVPFTPSLVAVIVTAPSAIPVTSPEDDTVATLSSLLAHVTVCPVSVLPSLSRVVALSCTDPPTTIDGLDGAIVTDATPGASTVTVEASDFPPVLAAICTSPGAMPETTPSSETVAMSVCSDAQKTFRPVRTPPFASWTVTCSVTVAPT